MKNISGIFFFLSVLFVADVVFAADFVVESGDTETTTQVLSDDGDQGLIELGGTISTIPDDEYGVYMQNDNQSVLNQGMINTQGSSADAILNEGNNASITNNGSITTQDTDAYGVRSEGNNVNIVNNGTITTMGVDASGIQHSSGNAPVIINTGMINTQGQDSVAIYADVTDDAFIQHTGSITTEGDGADGLVVDAGENNTVISTGSILIQGSDAYGIYIDAGDRAKVTNSGLITVLGVDAFGINIEDSESSHVINSGTVISTQSYAINFNGSTNPTLTLQQGSNLQGDVGSLDDTLNLNVEKGLNLLLTLSDDSDDFGDLNIDSPYILFNSKQIAVFDQTLFHMQEDVAADISDTILGGIYHDCCPNPCDCGVWTQTVGSYRHRCESDDFIEYKDWHVGQVVGYDTNYCGATFGIFGGYLYGEGETEHTLDKLCHNTFFAGLSFTQKICDACVGLTFAAGYVDWEQELIVADNLAEGGLDRYKFDTNAALFTSEFMINKQFCCECWNPKLTFYLRHVGLYLGKDKHEGVNATIGFEDRNIDLLTTRLDVAIPQKLCGYCLEPFVGVYGRYQLRGDKLDLNGTSTVFDVGFTDSLVAGVVGVRGYHNVCNKELVFSLSGDFDNEKSSRVLGSLGIKF